MNNLEKFKAELAKDLSANMYSEEYILQRLENLCLIAISQGKIEGANLEIIGEFLTEPESINPEDMVKGEWYVVTDEDNDNFLFKFNGLLNEKVYYSLFITMQGVGKVRDSDYFYNEPNEDIYRKATREEVIKYFPNEFMPPEIDSNGFNDKGFICPASN